MAIAKYRDRQLDGDYSLRGSYRLQCQTGAVTVIAGRTATAGHLFSFRWSSSTSVKCYLKRVAARFILTTAYGTAQETGLDMILARSYTASHTGATAVDVGSTVTNTGKLATSMATSLIVANAVRVANAGALTAGTHTFDANAFALIGGWSGAIGDCIPAASSGLQYADLYNAQDLTTPPIVFSQDEGFVLRNSVLMGATGVGRWDFIVEWDEGTPTT